MREIVMGGTSSVSRKIQEKGLKVCNKLFFFLKKGSGFSRN